MTHQYQLEDTRDETSYKHPGGAGRTALTPSTKPFLHTGPVGHARGVWPLDTIHKEEYKLMVIVNSEHRMYTNEHQKKNRLCQGQSDSTEFEIVQTS